MTISRKSSKKTVEAASASAAPDASKKRWLSNPFDIKVDPGPPNVQPSWSDIAPLHPGQAIDFGCVPREPKPGSPQTVVDCTMTNITTDQIEISRPCCSSGNLFNSTL